MPFWFRHCWRKQPSIFKGCTNLKLGLAIYFIAKHFCNFRTSSLHPESIFILLHSLTAVFHKSFQTDSLIMCFGGVDLEGGLKGAKGFFRLDTITEFRRAYPDNWKETSFKEFDHKMKLQNIYCMFKLHLNLNEMKWNIYLLYIL